MNVPYFPYNRGDTFPYNRGSTVHVGELLLLPLIISNLIIMFSYKCTVYMVNIKFKRLICCLNHFLPDKTIANFILLRHGISNSAVRASPPFTFIR